MTSEKSNRPSNPPPRASGKLLAKLHDVHQQMEQHLETPFEVLDLLVTLVSKGEEPSETWELLHNAAARDDKIQELAFAYENVCADKRVRLLTADQQAYIYLWAVHFFGEQFKDPEGALAYGQRALAVDPAHQPTFEALEYFLAESPAIANLAPLYFKAAQNPAEEGQTLPMLLRAAELVAGRPADDDLARSIYERILQVDPRDFSAREALAARYLQTGHPHDAAKLFEQATEITPPLDDEELRDVRERLLDMYQTTLNQPERALPHVEALLQADPNHAAALQAAEALLEHRTAGLRATAALSDAYEAAGKTEQAIAMLNIELKRVRGPRRVEVGRRLAVFRQDVLNDPAGALELLGPVVAGDPGNDDIRKRFVALSMDLNQPQQAARLLSRALTTSRDASVRSRVGVDVGEVFLKTGDVKRAQAAFQQVVETGHDDEAVLSAARHLQELYAESADTKQLAHVLALVVEHEPEKERRQAAARRLARLCETELEDEDRAVIAYRALIGSPWTDDALQKLETIYDRQGSKEGMAEVFAARAERSKDPEEARELAFKAADMRSAHTRDRDGALDAWRQFIEKYGPSRRAYERMIPLLEQTEALEELSSVLEQNLKLSAPDERVPALARLGQLRLTRLSDAPGALAAFKEALQLDPKDAASRTALEKLLGTPEVELQAADILEPIYRAEDHTVGIVKVLEARASAGTEPVERLAALEEAVTLVEEKQSDADRALALSGRGLALAASELRERLGEWLDRVHRYAVSTGDTARCGKLLLEALADHAVDSPPMLALARACGDALAVSGDIEAAVATYRRALEFDPSPDLVARVDDLLSQQGSPEERLALYESALENEQHPGRRREFLHAIANVKRRDLNDVEGAVETWKKALEGDPNDLVARRALVEVYREKGDSEATYHELEQMLPLLEGEAKNAVLAQLADVAFESGSLDRALQHYRDLLSSAEVTDEQLARIEQAATQLNDGGVVERVLEQRIQKASDPHDKLALLERAGENYISRLDNTEKAANCWQQAGALAEQAAGDEVAARRLYERVLSVYPKSEAASRSLVELYARGDAWDRIESPFAVLLEVMAASEVVPLLLSLEDLAISAGAIGVFARMVDETISKTQPERPRARKLMLAKARALTHDEARHEEAATHYRHLIESAEGEAITEVEAFEAFLARRQVDDALKSERRWLYQWRVEHGADPVVVLMAWASTEERDFDDLERASALYEQVLERDPDRTDALTELARLRALRGDASGALDSLTALRDRSEGDVRSSVELTIGQLLMDPLERPTEALEAIERYMKQAPSDPEGLKIVRRALDFPEARAQAAKILENAADVAEDPQQRARVLESLLSISEDSAELRASRGRWLKALLKIKSDDPEGSLTVALRAAEEDPADDGLWDAAERLARRLDRPDPVALAYSRAIMTDLEPEVAETLGRRVVEFHEEWFEDSERVVELLQRVLELSPGANWAFDRLKLEFNAGGKWNELFALYDKALSLATDDATRIELLREVSMAAKDFAGDAERAVSYLEQLHSLSPTDDRVEAALERLYERYQRWRPLISLLDARLEKSDPAQAKTLRHRMAGLWMQLDEPLPALELIEAILDEGDATTVVDLLEQLVALPSARDSVAPTSDGNKRGRRRKAQIVTVREKAAQYLREHYQDAGRTKDVVRMLEVLVETAPDDEQRIRRLKAIVKVRLSELDDSAGAFQNVSQLVTLAPTERQYKKLLHQLAERLEAHAEQAELLVRVADQHELGVQVDLLSEAARLHQEKLSDRDGAIALYLRVAEAFEEHPEPALVAARELDPMLQEAGRFEERCNILERLAMLEPEEAQQHAALGEAARVAFDSLGDAGRSIVNWNKRLSTTPRDLEALNGLVLAYSAAQRWDDLVSTLAHRAELRTEVADKRADLVAIARVHIERRQDPKEAVSAWRAVYELLPDDEEAFGALRNLLTDQERWNELAELLAERAGREAEPELRKSLYDALGEVHKTKTSNAQAALDAFVQAASWASAIEVAGASHPDAQVGISVCRSLLDQAVNAWQAGDLGAAQAADFAIRDLSERLLEVSAHAEVVELFLRGADLPFEAKQRREFKREAACLCSDRLEDPERAIEIFKSLFAESPSDEVAQSSVSRLAQLLEHQEQFTDLVALWEEQATCREAIEDRSGAAVLWARAGELCEEKLNDEDRAIVEYKRGAALGGETSLVALARLYNARKDFRLAAEVLEWLVAQTPRETVGARALELAEAYLAAGDAKTARARLEAAAEQALDAQPVRARLAELYRAAKKYTPLAHLLALEASLSTSTDEKLALLKEAATLHVERRNDPNSAVGLLSDALELDPEDTELRLNLADALRRAGRYDESIQTLRAQVERYGARRPKKRAIVHYRLGLVCLAAERRAEALAELDQANKIDPAHAGVSQALARLAFEEGDLGRAERMYRSLLLVLGHAETDDSPSRAVALLDLSEIAEKQGDTGRSAEFIESAFEAALEHEAEARALEQALARRNRLGLLVRSLKMRLEETQPAAEAARTLGQFVGLLRDGQLGDSDAELGAKDLSRRAAAIHEQLDAESSGDGKAWTALATVYQFLGDTDREAKILERQVDNWLMQGELPEDGDPFYRLAGARLANKKTRNKGVDLLEQALDIDSDFERAQRLLEATLDQGEVDDARVIRLYERVARRTENQASLARALALAAALPDTSIQLLREGVSLAETLGDAPLRQLILERGAARDEGSLAASDHAWVMLELAKVKEAAGDAASAYDLRETAADLLPPEERRALLLSIAGAAREAGALARAARLLEILREDEPQDREVWEPLLAVYRQLEDAERLAHVLDETIPRVDSIDERNRLRLEQVHVVLKDDDVDQGVSLLREVLEDDPRNLEAAEQLTSLLKKTGRTTELADLLRVQLDAAKDRQKVDSIVAASMQLGTLLESKQHHTEASDVYRAVLDWDHQNREALRGVLRMTEHNGDEYALADALESLLHVEKPDTARKLSGRLVELREKLGDPAGVERALELAVVADPAEKAKRDALLQRYEERGEFLRMAQLLERAQKASPEDETLPARIVAAYRAAGEQERALKAIDRLLEEPDASADLYQQRAELRAELGDTDGAYQDMEKAYSLDPKRAQGLIGLLEKQLKTEPDNTVALMRLCDILVDTRLADVARAKLKEFVERHRAERDLLVRLIDLEREAEDWAAATASLEKLIEMEEGDGIVELALELADVSSKAGDAARARPALERAVESYPERIELIDALRSIYEAIGADRELAYILLHEAHHAENPELRFSKLVSASARLLDDGTEVEHALEVLDQARALQPESLKVASLMARGYSALDRARDGLAILEHAASAHRGRRVEGLGDVYVEMANIYQDEGLANETLQALTKAHELDMKNPHLAMRLGRLAMEMGVDQTALRAFRSVTITKPTDALDAQEVSRMKADAQYHLAVLAQRQGDVRKAKILCSKALQENSEHEEANALLAQLKGS